MGMFLRHVRIVDISDVAGAHATDAILAMCIGTVIIEQAGIFLVVNQAVFCSKGIVGGVQFCLRCLNVLVREVIQLLLNQFVDDLPQLHHTSYTAFGVVGQFNLRHDRVLSVVDLAINNRIAKILHSRVCRQRFALCFRICDVRGSNLHRSVITMSEKSDKLRAMLAKEKERRIKLNNRIEILERRIQEEDSAEVNEMVRTAKVTPEQLAALLRQSATATPNPAALSAVGATFEKEVDADED